MSQPSGRGIIHESVAVTKVQQNVTHAAEISEAANWKKLSPWFVKVNNWLDAFEIYSCQRLMWNEVLALFERNSSKFTGIRKSDKIFIWPGIILYTIYQANRSISLTARCPSGWDKKAMCILTTNKEFSLSFRKLNMDFVIKTCQNLRKVVVCKYPKTIMKNCWEDKTSYWCWYSPWS